MKAATKGHVRMFLDHRIIEIIGLRRAIDADGVGIRSGKDKILKLKMRTQSKDNQKTKFSKTKTSRTPNWKRRHHTGRFPDVTIAG
jgi:hypothetical protein